MNIQINYEHCNGCGICVSLCPEAFKFDRKGKIVIRSKRLSAASEKDCRQASSICPTEAIKVD